MAEIEKVNDYVFIDDMVYRTDIDEVEQELEVEQEVKEEPIEINVGDVFIDDKHYSERAKWCNDNGCYIEQIDPNEEGQRQFQIKAPTPKTEDELLIEEAESELKDVEAKINDIKDRLMYAMLLNDQDVINDLREEYKGLLNE